VTDTQAAQTTFEHVATGDITLHVAFAGPSDGETVILLHGFPDAWFGWELQIAALAEAGFRVIAPDQRGYNLSDKPRGVAAYQVTNLVDDVVGLADALGYGSFHLAGHDWGAAVAWSLAMRYPVRVRRLAIANVPHPAVMGVHLRTNRAQRRRSWYMFFFQLPWLPEMVARARDWQMLISAMPQDLTANERARYRVAWSRPGAIACMVNWYRAMMQSTGAGAGPGKVQAPTLLLWGKQDPHLGYEMAAPSLDYCDRGRLVTFDDATHWVMHDEPDEVSRLLIEHFSSESP